MANGILQKKSYLWNEKSETRCTTETCVWKLNQIDQKPRWSHCTCLRKKKLSLNRSQRVKQSSLWLIVTGWLKHYRIGSQPFLIASKHKYTHYKRNTWIGMQSFQNMLEEVTIEISKLRKRDVFFAKNLTNQKTQEMS